jgi:hypothetical protein
MTRALSFAVALIFGWPSLDFAAKYNPTCFVGIAAVEAHESILRGQVSEPIFRAFAAGFALPGFSDAFFDRRFREYQLSRKGESLVDAFVRALLASPVADKKWRFFPWEKADEHPPRMTDQLEVILEEVRHRLGHIRAGRVGLGSILNREVAKQQVADPKFIDSGFKRLFARDLVVNPGKNPIWLVVTRKVTVGDVTFWAECWGERDLLWLNLKVRFGDEDIGDEVDYSVPSFALYDSAGNKIVDFHFRGGGYKHFPLAELGIPAPYDQDLHLRIVKAGG